MNQPNVCKICSIQQAKYKCPTCLVRYCSVACYKTHKSVPCSRNTSDLTNNKQDVHRPCYSEYVDSSVFCLEDDGPDYVPLRKLRRLNSSERLRDILSNRHLRNYLKNIDDAKRPDLAMEKAMREPLFIEFADECLRLIHADD